MDREIFEKQYNEFLSKRAKSTQDELDILNAKAISHDNLFFTFDDVRIKGMTSLVIAMEEMSELQKEISKVIRNKGDIINILEELADVSICMDRIKMLLNISDDEFNAALKVKVEKLKERMLQEDEEIAKKAQEGKEGLIEDLCNIFGMTESELNTFFKDNFSELTAEDMGITADDLEIKDGIKEENKESS